MLLATDVSVVLIVVAMFVRIFPKITGLRQSAHIVVFHLPGFDTAMQLLRQSEAEREFADTRMPDGWPHQGPATIALQRVSVSVDAQNILDEVTFDIPAGAFVVIVGPTGAGKTTLLDCILGLRRPSSGNVLIDGYPLQMLPNSVWREGIGYLGQEPVLFNASIGDNLRWIRPETTNEELSTALRTASADFVEKLADGLDTPVGDRGGRLSGGERQRIALARALLGAPRVLVLDEATSALDGNTEEIVVEAITALKRRMTIVAITHRPALARQADFVVHLEGGRLLKIERQPDLVQGTSPEASS
jgi:ATP-binding cassette subfamily C protein